MPAQFPRAKDPKPLTKAQLTFATMFVKYRNIYKAAERAKIPRGGAVRTYNLPAVQDEIDRQMEVVRAERARQQVQDENLTNQLLDRQMIDLISNPKTSDSLKLEALRLGYVVTGKIQAGSTKVLEGGGAAAAEENSSSFSYRAVVNVTPAAVAAVAVAAPILPPEEKQPIAPAPAGPAPNLTPDVKPLKPAAPQVKTTRPPFGRPSQTGTIKLG